MGERPFRVAVDIGGTFTDTVLGDRHNRILATDKTPTTPDDPGRGALRGVERALRTAKAEWSQITGFVHGTTLATNALIERRGAVVATVTTRGFRDILEIAYERRYSQYDIDLVKPDLIVPRKRAFTIGGRIDAHGNALTPLQESEVAGLVADLERCGAEAVAVCLLHAYANPAHELRLRALLREAMPHLVVSLSHEVSPEAREFERLCTTIANAYIQPLMGNYLKEFENRFDAAGLTCPVLMMTAEGGMTTIETARRLPIRLVESGPAGGAILAARLAAETGEGSVLSFDMGGTTAKLCLIDSFQPQTARRFEIARADRFTRGSGMPVRIPVIEMIEIGAGGGSIAAVDRLGRVQVGPQSAGSEPGPAGFGKGGTAPTVSDADIALGLIDPVRFAEGRLAIDVAAAERALCRDIGAPLGLDAGGAARGVSDIVDEAMASAGRMHAVESGKDLGTRLMIAFGGNGPLHATRVARRAGVKRILVPRDPGVGSAVGFLFAPVSFETVQSRYATLDTIDLEGLNGFLETMARGATDVVRTGAPGADLSVRRKAFMRYRGQGHEIEIALPARALRDGDRSRMRADFEAEYRQQFRRDVPSMEIEILNWSVRVASDPPPLNPVAGCAPAGAAQPAGHRRIRCDVTGMWREAPWYARDTLVSGATIAGPALIVEAQTTTLVSADFDARVDAAQNLWLTRQGDPT